MNLNFINSSFLLLALLLPAFQFSRLFLFNIPIPNHVFIFLFLFFLNPVTFFKVKFNWTFLVLISYILLCFFFYQIVNYDTNNFILILYVLSITSALFFSKLLDFNYLLRVSIFLLLSNILYSLCQLFLILFNDYNLMLQSNINKGYVISDHSYLKILYGYSAYRLTGLFNENGPLSCFLLLANYVIYNSTLKNNLKIFLFFISSIFVFLTGSKLFFAFFILSLYFLIGNFIYLILFLLAFVFTSYLDISSYIDIFDFKRRINDFNDTNFELFANAFLSSTQANSTDTIPQDFFAFNANGLGYLLTFLLFIFAMMYILSINGLGFYNLVCVFALLGMAGSLSNFLWFYFLLSSLIIKNAKNYI